MVTVVAVIVITVGINWPSAADRAPGLDFARYLDSQACQACHAEIYRSYRQVAMGRSLYRLTPENVIEDYTAANQLYHAPSNRHYRMIQRGEKFYQRRHQLDAQGNEINVFEQEVSYIIGSGNNARTYLHLTESGILTQLPVTWYTQEQRWAMSPGYDHPLHEGFRFRITHSCMFCHNAYPNLPEPSERLGHKSRFSQELPLGIDCQRCHGPGSHHVELASAGVSPVQEIRQAIVNPARLSPERQMDVCMQCHAKTASERIRRFGRSVYSYRPGELLDDYMVHFDLVDAESGGTKEQYKIDSSSYRLLQSSCFLKGKGAMTCTTCHDPHQTPKGEEAVRHYRQRCLDCHSQPSQAAHPEPAQTDCRSCHMPRRRTEDAVHVAMTDHIIQRLPPTNDLLAPLEEDHSPRSKKIVLSHPDQVPPFEQDLYVAIMRAESGTDSKQEMALLQQVLEKGSTRAAEPYLKLASLQMEAGDVEDAEVNVKRVLEIDPDVVDARLRLGDLLTEKGRLTQAAMHYRKILEADRSHPEAHIGLGLLLRRQQQTERAIQHFQKSLELDPQSVEAHLNLGSTMLALGRLERAEHYFRRLLLLEQGMADPYLNLGVIAARQGRSEEAITAFQQAIVRKLDFVEAYYNLGLEQARLGRRRKALAAFQQVVRLQPSHASAHYNLGVAQAGKGDLPIAIASFSRAVQLNPSDADAHFSLGIAYRQTGQLEKAVQSFQQTIRIKPDFAAAYSNLGVTYVQLDRTPEALQAFEKSNRLKEEAVVFSP